jgi:hypothetical protein
MTSGFFPSCSDLHQLTSRGGFRVSSVRDWSAGPESTACCPGVYKSLIIHQRVKVVCGDLIKTYDTSSTLYRWYTVEIIP